MSEAEVYQKKPVDILAWHFTKENFKKGVPKEFKHETISLWSQYGGEVIEGEIETLEGNHKITENDYLIRGVKGEYYPCKPDIFEMTYTRATADHIAGVGKMVPAVDVDAVMDRFDSLFEGWNIATGIIHNFIRAEFTAAIEAQEQKHKADISKLEQMVLQACRYHCYYYGGKGECRDECWTMQQLNKVERLDSRARGLRTGIVWASEELRDGYLDCKTDEERRAYIKQHGG